MSRSSFPIDFSLFNEKLIAMLWWVPQVRHE
jgi:hypothetical protein